MVLAAANHTPPLKKLHRKKNFTKISLTYKEIFYISHNRKSIVARIGAPGSLAWAVSYQCAVSVLTVTSFMLRGWLVAGAKARYCPFVM